MKQKIKTIEKKAQCWSSEETSKSGQPLVKPMRNSGRESINNIRGEIVHKERNYRH